MIPVATNLWPFLRLHVCCQHKELGHQLCSNGLLLKAAPRLRMHSVNAAGLLPG